MDNFTSNEYQAIKLSYLIGKSEMQRLFCYEYCELTPDFLGFLNSYYDLQTIPKDFTIIDIGCYQALHGVIYSEWAYKSLIERKFYWKGTTNDNRKIKYRI